MADKWAGLWNTADPLGPGGARIYRVRIRRKPSPTYIELREDQLELMPADY